VENKRISNLFRCISSAKGLTSGPAAIGAVSSAIAAHFTVGEGSVHSRWPQARIMKRTFIILVSCLLLAGCRRPDADLARQISGTWRQEAHYGPETHYITAVYASDGGFAITTKAADFTNDMAGTWRVEGKVILLTVTNASRGNFRYIGQVLKCRIDHVDSHQLDYQDIIERVGPTNSLTR
jgi:hypothetical protein